MLQKLHLFDTGPRNKVGTHLTIFAVLSGFYEKLLGVLKGEGVQRTPLSVVLERVKHYQVL